LPETYSERHIKSTITAGSVYYFYEKSIGSPKQHRFIVINIDPLNDTTIILVCASRQIAYFKKLRSNCPSDTLVEMTPLQYSGFTHKSIIDCNKVFPVQISDIATKFQKSKLQILPIMGLRLIKNLREGVLLSPMVDENIKTLLR
jgi:hypothetical protein